MAAAVATASSIPTSGSFPAGSYSFWRSTTITARPGTASSFRVWRFTRGVTSSMTLKSRQRAKLSCPKYGMSRRVISAQVTAPHGEAHRRRTRLPPGEHERNARPTTCASSRIQRIQIERWYAWQDSNLRPLGPQPNALSPELQARSAHSTPPLHQPMASPWGGKGGIRTLEGRLRPLTA